MSTEKIILMWKNAALLFVACVVSVLMAEGISRFVCKPEDCLRPKLASVPHHAFTRQIQPGVKGFDANGLRNSEVPETVDILAVGDSMTYGHGVVATESWPAHLAALTGKSVYNAGVEGFSPLEYLYMIRKLVPDLNPEQVIVMLYVGNDPSDAYRLVHRKEYWKDYRREGAQPPEIRPPKPKKLHTKLKIWLQYNSVLYNTMKLVARNTEFGFRYWYGTDREVYEFVHLGRTFFISKKSDFPEGQHAEHQWIVMRALGEIVAFCAERNIDLHFAIMPLYHNLFYPFMRDQLTDAEDKLIRRDMRSAERFISEWVDFFSAEGIPHTNLTAPMTRALEQEIIFPIFNFHPNEEGYRVIAEVLADAIEGR